MTKDERIKQAFSNKKWPDIKSSDSCKACGFVDEINLLIRKFNIS